MLGGVEIHFLTGAWGISHLVMSPEVGGWQGTWLKLSDLALGKSFISLGFMPTYLVTWVRQGVQCWGSRLVRTGSPENSEGAELVGGKACWSCLCEVHA